MKDARDLVIAALEHVTPEMYDPSWDPAPIEAAVRRVLSRLDVWVNKTVAEQTGIVVEI